MSAARFFAPAYCSSARRNGRCFTRPLAPNAAAYVAMNANGRASSLRFSARWKQTRPT